MKELYENYLIPPESNIRIPGIPEDDREKGTESLFKQIINENSPNLCKELDSLIRTASRTPNYLNTKRPSPRHTVLKLSKINDKEPWLGSSVG